jgi:beta-galactosidase
VIVNPVHVAHWGTYVSTPEIADFEATVRIRTTIQNQSGEDQEIELATTILDPAGNQVAVSSAQQPIATVFEFDQTLRIPQPVRWDIEEPKLYQAISTLRVNGTMVDRYKTSFGIRELRFDANEGFFLNGRNLKFKGVCMHHDLGALGAAMNRRALERQLEMLQEMGCNAIRTSHNPPAPELLESCDRMGFLVIDEAFDEWKIPKLDHGYHTLFEEWVEKDLRAMIKRDRNHPCIIMWSIGNEIGEQRSESGAEVTRFLTDIAHDEDPTRPVTAGFNESDAAIKNGLADVVDIPGWNYQPHRYQQYHQLHPEWIQYGSETESTVSSRGAYYFPAEREIGLKRDTLHVSSYDLSSPMWAYPPDVEFAAQDGCPFIMGEFAWTGWDYLGEPTPYKEEWPSRSAYFGSIDLCGIPKDRFYLYRSQWRNDIPTLHLLPHWNWEGREGEVTPVHCYTSYDSAELFLNGRSLGKRSKDPTVSYRIGGKPPWYGSESTPVQRYRLIWEDVRYEPGILKVVAFDQDGKPVAQEEVRTAGAPANITLLPDRSTINADGTDLSFVTVKITDADGNLCPLADNLVTFELDGPRRIVAVDNGDQTSLEPFAANSRKAFHGMCMLIVGSEKGASGEIRITASSRDLHSGITSVDCE